MWRLTWAVLLLAGCSTRHQSRSSPTTPVSTTGSMAIERDLITGQTKAVVKLEMKL